MNIFKEALIKLYATNSLYIYAACFHMYEFEFNNSIPTACIMYNLNTKKYKIVINDEWVLSQNLTSKQLLYIYIHEILHGILNHCHRLINVDANIGNLAKDHVINNMLNNDISLGYLNNLEKIPGIFIIPELENQKLTVEEVYDWIMKNYNHNKFSMNLTLDQLNDFLQNNKLPSQDGNTNHTIPQDGNTNHTIPIEIDELVSKNDPDKKLYSHQDIHLSDENLKSLQEEIKGYIKAAICQKQHRINKGYNKGSIEELIEKLVEVNLPWEKIFENVLLNYKKLSYENKSWSNYNKKLSSSTGIILPGMMYDDVINLICISIDTSGSMTTQDLQKGLGVIKGIMDHSEKVQIIYHDYGIHKILEFETTYFNILEIGKINGRGGTSHEEVFNYLQKKYDEEADISIYISFSDLESDIDKIWNKYTWHKHIPNVFISTTNIHLNNNQKIIKIKE